MIIYLIIFKNIISFPKSNQSFSAFYCNFHSKFSWNFQPFLGIKINVRIEIRGVTSFILIINLKSYFPYVIKSEIKLIKYSSEIKYAQIRTRSNFTLLVLFCSL